MPRQAIALALAAWASLTSPAARADTCEDIVAQHMVAQALLAAHLVAVAERAGNEAGEINAALEAVAEASAIDEFWITDPSGHAYLTTPASTSPSARTRPSSRRPPPSGPSSTAARRPAARRRRSSV
ncbi:MAG TPA: hypothetical protein VHG92_07925 [Afifellaceae bacterium]|nr:hypothetical protein [Afifellaceae bacterium]